MCERRPANDAGGPLDEAAIDRHVGRRIASRRDHQGIDQSELASLLGMTVSQIRKYEDGINRITVSKLYLVAAALGTPVAYFFEGLAGAPDDLDEAPE